MLSDLVVSDGVSDDFLREVKAFIKEWQNEETFIEVQTSGSTGTPKLIQLEKDRVRASANATASYFSLEQGKTALLNLSPQYIAGKLMIVRAYEHQMRLVLAPLSDNPLLQVQEQEIDFAAFVPSQVKAIIEDDSSRKALQNLGTSIIGGAPLDGATENALVRLNVNAYATFGMTESITHFAVRKVGTPVYHCLPAFEISTDERSCLVLHSNKVIAETIYTNDVIDLIDRQSFKFLGRHDHVINSGGVKIHPEKVEKMIAHLIPDNRFYVTSKQDDKFGEVAVLVVEGDVDVERLLVETKESLPKYHNPKEVIKEDQFEMTKTSKIIRKKY